MNKRLRTKRRIEKDKAARALKRSLKQEKYGNYDNIVTNQHYTDVYPKSLRNVGWKRSVHNYEFNVIDTMQGDIKLLKNEKLPKPRGSDIITIRERGKERTITPIHIADRVMQKIFCDHCLTPLIKDKLIYDNGASLDGKGVQFTRNRMNEMLVYMTRKYKDDFYALKFDFKSYFDSIPHSTCREVLSNLIDDERTVEILMDIIKSPFAVQIKKKYKEPLKSVLLNRLENDMMKGICLGSQVSQSMALLIPNEMDHYIKDIAQFKCYIRYMDDGIVLAKTREELVELLGNIEWFAMAVGLKFNKKKTKIVKASHGFTFLKTRYHITKTGKIVRRLSRDGITRNRRKLIKLKAKIDNGERSIDDAYNVMQSWLAHSAHANCYTTRQSMLKLYDELYGGYKITKNWKKKNGGKFNVLKTDKWAKYHWDSDIGQSDEVSASA